MEFLQKLVDLPLSMWVAGSDWGYPLVLCAHSIGMALVVGVVLMLGVRVLGFARGIPLNAFVTLFKFAWAGFAVNAISGVMLFMANAVQLSINWTFILKIILIAIGGVLLFYLWRAVRSQPETMANGEPFTLNTRILAAVTMLCWLGAITSGRYIGYVLDAAAEAAYK